MAYYFVLSAYLFICFILIFSYEVIFYLVLYTICLYTFMFFIFKKDEVCTFCTQWLNSKKITVFTQVSWNTPHLSLVRPTNSHALKLTASPSIAVVRLVVMLKQSNILTAQCDTFQENKPLNILYLLHINIREKKSRFHNSYLFNSCRK